MYRSSENYSITRKMFGMPVIIQQYWFITDHMRTPLAATRSLSRESNSTALEFRESDVLLMSQDDTAQHESRKPTSRRTPKLKHVCTICGKNFAFPSLLEIHTPTHDISASLMCEICGRIFRHLPSLNRHKRDDHASQSRERAKVLCDECGKAFRGPCDLKRHMHCHSVEKSCFCSSCSQVFPNHGALHKHKLLQHDKVPMDKIAKHECVVCKQWFEDARNLKRHSVVHTKQRPFVCVLCAKAYSQLEVLRRHQRTKHQK
ncbi:hypothetical protein CRM22_003289 [Opisthorchis felineus]|uniref:C2H2-type domain-containing protein n=1 Tax=Opisthorchis felineus TaxID=147828 RepID=A0A4S2M874_OPIFE|nr:hypothetical protein CRM22_003289 [Opisthorchis felineus]